MSEQEYRCGTCGTPGLTLRSVILSASDIRWQLTCRWGHVFLPTGGEEFEFGTELSEAEK